MATLREWVKWLEAQCAEGIAGAGIDAVLRRTVEGPQTITLYFQIYNPTKRNLATMAGLAPSITALTNLPATVRQIGSTHEIQVDHPQPWTPAAAALAKYGNRLTVPVGVAANGKPVTITFGDMCPVAAWIGPPGSGKSTAIMSTLALLVNQTPATRAQLFISAKKVAAWSRFGDLPHTEEVATDLGASLDLIRYIAGPVLEHRQQDGIKWPAIFLIVDDVTGLVEADSSIGSPLAVIATEGREHQIFMILGLHAAGRKAAIGGGLTEEAIRTRIVYRPSRSDASSRNTGQRGIDLSVLSARAGDAMFISGREQKRIATPHGWERVINRIAPERRLDQEAEQHRSAERAALHASATPTRERTTSTAPAPAERGDTKPGHVRATGDPAPAEPARVERVSPGQISAPAAIGAAREPTTDERKEIIRYIHQRTAAGIETSGRHLIDVLFAGRRGRTTQSIAKSLLSEADRTLSSAGIDPFAGEPEPAQTPRRLSAEEKEQKQIEDEEQLIRQNILNGSIDWSTVTFGKGG